MKKKLTNADIGKLTFVSNGTMLYFEADKQFLYFIKEQTPDLLKKMQMARQSKTPYQIYPYEVVVAVMRKNLTTQNIGQFYKEEYLRFSGTSQQFLEKYFDKPYYTRHTKTKGTMQLTDYIVRTWHRFIGSKKNTTVFALSQQGKNEMKKENDGNEIESIEVLPASKSS